MPSKNKNGDAGEQRRFGNTPEQLKAALRYELDAIETLTDQKEHTVRLLADTQEEIESFSAGDAGKWRIFTLILIAVAVGLFIAGPVTWIPAAIALFGAFLVGMRFLSERKSLRERYSNLRTRRGRYVRKIEDYDAKIEEHQAVINSIKRKLDE